MACKKKCYRSEEAARGVMEKMQKNPPNESHYVPTAVYYCHGCKSWHLTSRLRKFQGDARNNRGRRN